jgi:FkbM family methyltransferase
MARHAQRLTSALKRAVIGTRLEPIARRVHAPLAARASAARTVRDEAQNALYDSQAFAVMGRVLRADSNAVDVGCHRGAYLSEMLRLAPHGIHYAFEPLPDMFDALWAVYGGLDTVVLSSSALGNEPGLREFLHVLEHPQFSGYRRRRYPSPTVTVRQLTVTTERLDDVLPADMPVAFIKIDVEGAELEVMEGGLRTLGRCRPVVVFELGGDDDYGVQPSDVHDLLSGRLGMRLLRMADWLADPAVSGLDRQAFIERHREPDSWMYMAVP